MSKKDSDTIEGQRVILKFTCINDDNKIEWFKCKEITKYLEYTDANKQVVLDHPENDNTKSLEQLSISDKPTNIHPTTIFINKTGMYELLSELHNDKSKILKKWLDGGDDGNDSNCSNGSLKRKRELILPPCEYLKLYFNNIKNDVEKKTDESTDVSNLSMDLLSVFHKIITTGNLSISGSPPSSNNNDIILRLEKIEQNQLLITEALKELCKK